MTSAIATPAARRSLDILCAAVMAAIVTVAASASFNRLAHGQGEIGIVAVVNDDVISAIDVSSRASLLLLSQQMPISRETINRMRPQALRTLIDERLRLQEAERLGIEIEDQEVDDMVSQLAEGNGMTVAQFAGVLSQAGSSLNNLKSQRRGEIAWNRIVRARLSRRIAITDGDVDSVIEQLQAGVGDAEVALSEIFLSVDGPESEPRVRRLASRIIQQLDAGVPFSTLASQLSEAPSAHQGGDMGWVLLDRLDPVLRSAVRQTQVGQYSQPVRGAQGLHILQVRDRRAASLPNAAGTGPQTELVLKQVILPLPQDATPAQSNDMMARANRARGIIQTCSDIDTVHNYFGITSSSDLGRHQVSELDPAVRDLVAGLQAGQLTKPMRLSAGVIMIMVCERETVSGNAEMREQIRNRLFQERLEALARRYMRDLRRAAVIDNRQES